MVDKGADIDLLFRNGLKDLEVLPPVGVWSTIYPAIRKKQKPYILLRAAAAVAVLLSISVLAYRWSGNISYDNGNPLLALSDESVQIKSPGFSPAIMQSVPVSARSDKNSVAGTKNNNHVAASDIEKSREEIAMVRVIQPATEGRTFNPLRIITPSGNLKTGSLTGKQDNSFTGTYSLYEGYDYEIPRNNSGKWTFSAAATPSYNMRTGLGKDKVSEQISSSEQAKISYSGGLGVAYKISKRLSVQSGLYYTSIGQEIENIYSFSGFNRYDVTKGTHNFEVLTSGGVIYTDNDDVFLMDNSGGRVLTVYTNDVFDPAKANLSYVNNTLRQTFSYLEMPIILRYKLIDKTIDFNLIGGLSYNLLVNNTVSTFADGHKYTVGKTEGLNPFMVSSSVGMGMEYNLSGKISLNLEPMFRYYLNPFSEMAGIKTHPYSFGLFSGLSYRF